MSMRRVHIHAVVHEDIINAMRFIARDSVDAAIKWSFDLDDKFRLLARIPGTGTDRSNLRPGLRSSPFGEYLVFFERAPDGIAIVRVIHGARKYARLFKKK
jgi:toxin ParE1/3/4